MSDREVKVPANTFQVHLRCNSCEIGSMKATPDMPMLMSSPPQFHHTCNECGATEHFTTRYPAFGSGPVKARLVLRLHNEYVSNDVQLPAGSYPVEKNWIHNGVSMYEVTYFEHLPDDTMDFKFSEVAIESETQAGLGEAGHRVAEALPVVELKSRKCSGYAMRLTNGSCVMLPPNAVRVNPDRSY